MLAAGLAAANAGRRDRFGGDAAGAYPYFHPGEQLAGAERGEVESPASSSRDRTAIARRIGDGSVISAHSRERGWLRRRQPVPASRGRPTDVMTARGLIVAAPHSGAGKTTVTLALLAALRRRGVIVRAAKAGPDYIDPAFHAAVTGSGERQSRQLGDAGKLLDALAARSARTAQTCSSSKASWACSMARPCRGAPGRRGATADLAAHFRLPVVLVIDVARQAQSAAAVVRGFATHDPAVRIAGVILNRVGSERHRAFVADAIAALGIPVLGALPREAALALPERHLGLVQAGEHADLAALIDRLAATAETHLDLDAIVACAAPFTIASARTGTH